MDTGSRSNRAIAIVHTVSGGVVVVPGAQWLDGAGGAGAAGNTDQGCTEFGQAVAVPLNPLFIGER
jgi:hypothetical protein